MRFAVLLSLLYTMLVVTGAQAANADAREVARLNNCTPKKIEVYQQTLGSGGQTIYRVECNMPKGKDENAAKGADAILVQCAGSICEMLRPINVESK